MDALAAYPWRRTPRGRRAAAALVGVLVLAAGDGCQAPPPGGTSAPGPAQPTVKTLEVADLRGFLEFVARRRDQEQRSKTDLGDTLSKETIFQENIGLNTRGYVYHPNLFEFALGGLFGLLQHSFRQDFAGRVTDGSDDGTVLEFDFTGNVLKQKKYPGFVYARRSQGIEPRLFRSSVETTTDNYGLTWQYLDAKMPTRLQFDYNAVKYHPFAGTAAESDRRNLNLRFDTAYKFSEHNVLSFLYEHQGVKEHTEAVTPVELDYGSDEFTLAHRLEFGEKRRNRLESELNYYRQHGSLETDRLRWRERLRLQHTDTLRSWYEFEARDQTRGSLANLPPLAERTFRFQGAVEHRLFESLVSQLIGFAQRQDFESGAKIDLWGVEGRLNYQKKNPFGTLRADYMVHLEQESREGREMRAEIRDERQSFRDPDPIVLTNPNIDTGSIVITAEDGITFYQLERDYRLRTVGDRIEIERIPTGRIADRQTVLIDYIYRLGGSFKLDTVRQELGVRQDFTFGLSPYYRLRWQDQSISPVSARGAVPEDITAHILGLEFRRGSLDLGAEYEDHFSTINAFDVLRLRAGYSHHFKFGGTAAIRAAWTGTSYDPPRDRDTRLFTFEGRYRQKLWRTLTVEGAAVYRDGTDSLTGDQRGIDLSLALEWLIRQIEFRITAEQKQFDDNFARNETTAFFVQVRRKF
jgi:hypothetical protein